MVGGAFLQCFVGEQVHGLLHERLCIPAAERNTFRAGPTGNPILHYWLADIQYDSFGLVRFFGLEIDLAALLACYEGGSSLQDRLVQAFPANLAACLGEGIASGLPALDQWDCNSLQYTAVVGAAGLQALQAAGMPVLDRIPPVLQGGKHAVPPGSAAVAARQGGGTLAVTCRRSKINSLLKIKGLERRPLLQLLQPEIEEAALRSVLRKCPGVSVIG